MQKPRFRIYGFLALMLFLFSGCLKIGEYYVGLHMQPDTGEAFEPGLNVFGVVKCGPSLDSTNHFFEVHKLLNLANSNDTIFQVIDAEIQLTRRTPSQQIEEYFPQPSPDSLYSDSQIEVSPGDHWSFLCHYDSFSVSASCIVPQLPVLRSEIQRSANSLSLILQADSTAFLYQIYVFESNQFAQIQHVPTPGKQVEIEIPLSWQPRAGSGLVYIFAYDQNVRIYQTTSNTFFKPNTYRPAFSTVDGGYGVFGAISSTLVSY